MGVGILNCPLGKQFLPVTAETSSSATAFTPHLPQLEQKVQHIDVACPCRLHCPIRCVLFDLLHALLLHLAVEVSLSLTKEQAT